jgi:tetratricopeptide (TPR) repeat protein
MSLASDLRDGGRTAVPVLQGVVDGTLPVPDPELRSMAALALADVLMRTGRPDQGRRLLLDSAGRVEPWAVLGPYGKFEGLALARTYPPEGGDLQPSGAEAALPARPPRRVDTSFGDGRILIPDGMGRRGAFYAATDLVLSEPARIRVRVGGRPSMKVFLDGRVALELDRMRERPPLARSFVAALGPGRHRLMIKLVPRPGMSPVDVTVMRENGDPLGDTVRAEHPAVQTPAAGEAALEPVVSRLDEAAAAAIGSGDPARVVAASWWLLGRNRVRDLGGLLKAAHERWPDAPLIQLWLGEYYQKAETGAAPEEDLAAARGHLEDALESAPDLTRAHGLLAELEIGSQHLDRAWEHLEDGLSHAPEQPDLLLLQHRIARERGWFVEAAERIERALSLAPGRNDLLDAAISFYRDAGAVRRLGPLLEEQARRYTLAEEPPEHLLQRGELDRASEMFRQMVAAGPSKAYGWIGWLRALVEAERHAEALEALERAEQQFPDAGWISRLRAGVLAEQGADPERVEDSLRSALRSDPSQLELRETLQRRGEPDRLSRWLVDPKQILEAADEPARAMDAALLADIAVTLVDDLGGQTELYQGIHKVYTRAGVEQEGELEVLPGARIERIRIHKADGRVVDVPPGGKRPISLPGLEPGDAFEYVWERYTPPLGEVPGALDNSTIFLFQGEDRDYVLSRFVVLHDAALPVEACVNSRGLHYEEETEGRWRIRSWTARSMPRIRPEPHVADRFEATPHVRLGYGLSWQDVGDAVRDALIGMLRPDPPLDEMAAKIREAAGSESREALARALHETVNSRIAPGRRPFDLSTPASVAASAGEGNRLGVALALANTVGLEPHLVLARPIDMAGRDLECPTTFSFPYVMLGLEVGGSEVFLDYTGADHAYDTIPVQVAGSSGLRVPLDPERPVELIEIPRRDPGLLQEQLADVRLGPEGRVSGTLSIELEGPMAATTRRLLSEVPKSRMPQIEQGIAAQAFPGARVTSFETGGLEDPEAPLRLELAFDGGSLARRTPSGFAIPLTHRPLGLFEEFGSLPARRFAMLFAAQTLRRDRLNVTLPEGLELASAPEPVEVQSRFGSYRVEAGVEDGTLWIERVVKIPPQRIEPEEYSEFRSLLRTIDQVESSELRLRVESPALAP